MSVNKVILIGRLGADPEVRYTQGGQAVANFNLATHEAWTDRQGQSQEKTEWHRIVVWGRQAETCGEYLRKGREAYIEGRLETRQWQDREGQQRYTTEVKAQTVRFLGGRQSDNASQSGPSYNGGASQQQPSQQQAAPQAAPQQQAPVNLGAPAEPAAAPAPAPAGPQGGEFNDDDIPF